MTRAQPPRRAVAGSWALALRATGLRLWTGRLQTRRAARATAAAADRLYRDLVIRARASVFFRALGVPDTPEGRFEMIGLHAALILLRLRAEGAAGQALGQALFDLMVADLDQSLRELGVGDLGVGKQVRRLAGQFYARLRALDELIGSGQTSRLGAVLRANVWHGGRAPSALQVEALADYLIRCAHRLCGQSAGALLGGEAAFAVLEAELPGDRPQDRPRDRRPDRQNH